MFFYPTKTSNNCCWYKIYILILKINKKIEIPQGSHFLVQNGCIAALIESLFSNDAEVQKKAIIWLITLADEDVGILFIYF